MMISMVRKYVLPLILFLLFSFSFTLPAIAGSSEEMLQKRVDDLEKELKELKVMLQRQQQDRETEKVRVQQVEQRVEKTEQKVEKAEKIAAPSVISDFKFKPYGFVKLDAAYDDSRTNYGNFALYIPSESSHNINDNDFNMTARETRVGLHILAPETWCWTAKGRIEFDFYGDGTQHENKPEPLLRHAYTELSRGNFNVIAGQTSDLMSPLAANTLNYTVLWGVGNIGYRRPQLRATYNFPVNDKSKFITALAIARYKGLTNEDLDSDRENDGEDAGFPMMQARIGYASKLFAGKESSFGISGHFGKEEIHWGLVTAGEKTKRMESWSINGDFDLFLTSALEIKGEMFAGANLDDFFGGILQGVNPKKRDLINSIGGWAQATYQFHPQWKSNLGFGIDDPRNSDLSTGMRGRNTVGYVNVLYNLIPPVNIGLEYSHWDTSYIRKSSGINNRIQTSVIYNW